MGSSTMGWDHPDDDHFAVRVDGRCLAIQSTQRAFAAITDQGTVVAWGDVADGGASHAVRTQLVRVMWRLLLIIMGLFNAFFSLFKPGPKNARLK